MLIIFSILISISLSFIPEWNLTRAAKDLLENKDTYEYIVYDKVFVDRKEIKMKRRITKVNGIVKTKNIIYFGDDEIGKEVRFDNIQSCHKVFGRYIICPYGNFHPYDCQSGEYLYLFDAQIIGDWDLKCIYHSASVKFYVSYLRKKEPNFYYAKEYKNYKFVWYPIFFTDEYFDFKLNNKTLGGPDDDIPIISYLRKYGEMLLFSDNYINVKKECELHPTILTKISLPYIKGYIKNNTNNFYFVTYNNTKIFYTGHTNTTISDDFHLINITLIFNNKTSPFNFSNEVEIKNIDFIFRNKFIYYRLKKINENIFYHGIIDIELHKIIFNTKETINNFIPYSDKEMLAITPTAAYIICTYNNDGNCTDYCPNENYIINPNGNKCGLSCNNNQYRFISNNTCIDFCNRSIYIYQENYEKLCGKCEEFDKDKPYKFINGTICYRNNPIPDKAIIIDDDLKLLKCKEDEGYYFENETCFKKIKCYEKCEKCNEESEDEKNQNCTKCKDNYVLENGNCLDNCSEGYGAVDGKCQICENANCDKFHKNSCNCSQCKEHFFLTENICSECSQNCKNCFGKNNNCTSCDNSSFLFNGQCLSCTIM